MPRGGGELSPSRLSSPCAQLLNGYWGSELRTSGFSTEDFTHLTIPSPQLLFSLLASCLSFLKVVRVSCRQHNFRRHKDIAVGLSGQSPRWVTRLTPEGLELSITEYLTVKVSLSELCLQKVLKSSSHCKVSWRTSTKSHVYETFASLQRLSQT